MVLLCRGYIGVCGYWCVSVHFCMGFGFDGCVCVWGTCLCGSVLFEVRFCVGIVLCVVCDVITVIGCFVGGLVFVWCLVV